MKKIIVLAVLSLSLQGCFQACGTDGNIELCLTTNDGDSATSDSGSSWSSGGSSWGDGSNSWSDGGSFFGR